MSHSISPVEDWIAATPLASEVEFDPAGPYRYRVFQDDDRLLHEEVRLGAGDAVLTQQALPVSWIIGSGKRGRTFATSADGVLRESPITWYANGPHWDLSPGYNTADQPHFQRRVTTACLLCHAGQVSAPGPNRFDPSAPFVESGIGCERCHGPGAAHVARHEQAFAPAGPDPIVNPSRLDPVRREAVCNRCHLSGGHRVLHAGKSDADFQPGQRLCDVWTIFIDDVGSRGDGPGISQVQQMRSSACYRSSEGRLGCISCHDAHEVPAEAERLDYYRAKCVTCHVAEGRDCSAPALQRAQLRDACTECHMPRHPTSNLPHTAQTDHRILRRPSEASLSQSRKPVESLLWDEGQPPLDAAQIERARQILVANAEHVVPNSDQLQDACNSLRKTVAANPGDGRAWEALARAATRANQPSVALSAGLRAVERWPDDDATWRVLAAAAIAAQNWETADRAVAASLKLVPDDAESWELAAYLRMRQGRLANAVEAATKSLALDPGRPRPHAYLADALMQLRQPTDARRHFELFRSLSAPPQ
ncbi:MAG: tetratricopeptide repeat protein [Planctomycetaceae bacterium]|nr:tetratricopeptide repeat protein [Planctomycetaceae bacterium]